MSDLMFEPTGPLQQWQKWANLARLEAIRADKAEALCDKLLSALKAVESFRYYEHADQQHNPGWCPWCLATEPGPHNERCQRQAAIVAVEEK